MPGCRQCMQGEVPVIAAPACLLGMSTETQVVLEALVGTRAAARGGGI